MKLRIQGSAIRFRLNRREVSEFAAAGRVSASVAFGGGTALAYTLAASSTGEMAASFQDGEVLVNVPRAAVQSWAVGDQVGMHGEQRTGTGGMLEIIIEKDFQCMHKGEEAKDPEAYPNPMAAA